MFQNRQISSRQTTCQAFNNHLFLDLRAKPEGHLNVTEVACTRENNGANCDQLSDSCVAHRSVVVVSSRNSHCVQGSALLCKLQLPRWKLVSPLLCFSLSLSQFVFRASNTATVSSCRQPLPASTMVEKLSIMQIVEIKEAFAVFDREGLGSIGSAELERVLESLGHKPDKDELKVSRGLVAMVTLRWGGQQRMFCASFLAMWRQNGQS